MAQIDKGGFTKFKTYLTMIVVVVVLIVLTVYTAGLAMDLWPAALMTMEAMGWIYIVGFACLVLAFILDPKGAAAGFDLFTRAVSKVAGGLGNAVGSVIGSAVSGLAGSSLGWIIGGCVAAYLFLTRKKDEPEKTGPEQTSGNNRKAIANDLE